MGCRISQSFNGLMILAGFDHRAGFLGQSASFGKGIVEGKSVNGESLIPSLSVGEDGFIK